MLKSILAASDLPSRSEPVMRRTVQLAETTGARLTILHVVEGDPHENRMRAEIRSAEDCLPDQVAGLGRPSGSEVAVAAGHAFHVIGDAARARDADLIVMGPIAASSCAMSLSARPSSG